MPDVHLKTAPRGKTSVVTMGCAVLAIGSLGIAVLSGFWFSVNPPDRARTQPVAVPAPAPVTAVDAAHPTAQLLSESEKKYFGAAGGFLKSVNEQDTVLAKTMAGASTGESTLGDIKEAIERTRRVLDAAYFGDYQPAPPPPALAALNKKIEKCKALHDSAFRELLEYWDDSNTAHIESGSATLKRAALVTNECIADVTKAMKQLAEERKKATKGK